MENKRTQTQQEKRYNDIEKLRECIKIMSDYIVHNYNVLEITPDNNRMFKAFCALSNVLKEYQKDEQ